MSLLPSIKNERYAPSSRHEFLLLWYPFLTLPSPNTLPKHSNLRSTPSKKCVGEARVECQEAKGKGKKIFMCHFDKEQEIYKTLCISESGAPGHLMKHSQDYCGECVENIVIRVMEFLDTKNNAEDALSTVNLKDMSRIVEKVKSYVSDGALKDLITPESIIEAYYPHDSVLDLKHILSPEAIMSKYYPELYEEIINGTDSSQQTRSLEAGSQVSVYPPSNPMSLALQEPPGLPVGCWTSLFGWFAGLIGVMLALIPLLTSPLYTTVVGNWLGRLFLLRFGSSEMVLAQFLNFVEKDVMLSGNNFKVIWVWAKAMFNVSALLGWKLLFEGIKDAVMSTNPTAEVFIFITASLVLQIMAWIATGWTAFILQAAVLVTQIALFRLSSIEMERKCFAGECNPEKKPDCEDGNRCTENNAKCESGQWTCSTTDVICPGGLSCNPSDGSCKRDDELIPCVAVIDEDSSFGTPNQASRWQEFRTAYPLRPFCLLVPGPQGGISIPPNFLVDFLTIVHYNIVRDNGVQANADDWAVKCGLDLYLPAQVGYVGLFVDDSGSMRKSEVIASYNKFITTMAVKGLEVEEVVDTQENWILPFLTTLVPPSTTSLDPPLACATNDGRGGKCIDSGVCTSDGKIPVPWQVGDHQPICFDSPVNIQCCVDGEACVTNDGRGGKCMDSDACTTHGKVPVPWQPGDPTPNCSKYANNIQCCVEKLFVRHHV